MEFSAKSSHLVQSAALIALGILPFQSSASAASSVKFVNYHQESSRPQLLVQDQEKDAGLRGTAINLNQNNSGEKNSYTFAKEQKFSLLTNLGHQSSSLVALEPSFPPSESNAITISPQQGLNVAKDAIYIPVESPQSGETSTVAIPIQVEKNYVKQMEGRNDLNLSTTKASNSIPINIIAPNSQNRANLSDSDPYNNSAVADKPVLITPGSRTLSSVQNKLASVAAPSAVNKSGIENSSSMESENYQYDETEVVSTIPIQIDYYNPAIAPSPKEMLSAPDLPQLYSPEQYLPQGDRPFDGYIWPAKGVLTSGYGWRWGRMHKGIDIAAPVGTPIVAAADGEVISSGWNSGGYGNLVKLKHYDGSITLYAHNSKIFVRRGQKVKQGQHIANMGSTGFSTGPHLHFEIHPSGGKATNPMALLPRRR